MEIGPGSAAASRRTLTRLAARGSWAAILLVVLGLLLLPLLVLAVGIVSAATT